MQCEICKNPKLGLGVAAVIFALMALAHAFRLLMNCSITINGQEIPLLVSIIAMVMAGLMSYWMWMLRKE